MGLVSGCYYNNPSPGTDANMNAAATISSTNAWAVGNSGGSGLHHYLIEHFNGVRWGVVSVPASWGTNLIDVTAVNASNIWAVGDQRTVHWDGRSWSAPTSNPAGTTMAAIASGHDGSVIAAGQNASGPVVLYLSAAGWRPFPAQPAPPGSSRVCDGALTLTNVTETTSSDVWAVGYMHDANGGVLQNDCTYAAHWNGSSWTVLPTPSPGTWSTLAAVSARSPSDVWAVGDAPFILDGFGLRFDAALAMHWNGTSWQQVTASGGNLNDVDATGAHVWAVGMNIFGNYDETSAAIQRWSGSAFVNQPAPVFPGPGGFGQQATLAGVSVGDGLVLSVGRYQSAIPSGDTAVIDGRHDQ
jgi:hypothetical protein